MGNLPCFDPGRFDENDPLTDFKPLGERRVVVSAKHPSTQELLRAELIKKNVSPEEVGDTVATQKWSGQGGFQVRWCRYWLKEPGSDSWLLPQDVKEEDQEATPQTKFNFYLSFVQTVGRPGLVYQFNEHVDVRNDYGGWDDATIARIEQNYYYVRFANKGNPREEKAEWIHRFSTRLRKKPKYLDTDENDTPLSSWDSLAELDWIRVRHPNVNQMLPAHIILKDNGSKEERKKFEDQGDKFPLERQKLVIQYEDPSLLVQQETITRAQLEGYSWEAFKVGDQLKSKHPDTGVPLAATVVAKETTPEGEKIVIQYSDATESRRETILRNNLETGTVPRKHPPEIPKNAKTNPLDLKPEQIEEFVKMKLELPQQLCEKKGDTKIEFYSEFQKRWRYNRSYIYSSALKTVGLTVNQMDPENGHSLFRALSHQLFGTPNNFLYLRLKTVEHMMAHKEYYSLFVDGGPGAFEYYIGHKKKGSTGEYYSVGDHLDIQAICELYDARVEIYSELSPSPLDTIRFYQQFSNLPLIRLSYRGNDQYDSISKAGQPLPLTKVIELRKMPLGNYMTTNNLILNARLELFNKLEVQAIQQRLTGVIEDPELERLKDKLGRVDELDDKKKRDDDTHGQIKKNAGNIGTEAAPDTSLKSSASGQSAVEKTVVVIDGVLEFKDKDETRKVLEDLLPRLGLLNTVAKNGADDFYDRERRYPPDLKAQTHVIITYPIMKEGKRHCRIEGIRFVVDEAVKFLKSKNPAVVTLQEVAVFHWADWHRVNTKPKQKK